jgi:nucleotide-binding universal stress UspA family protein
MTSQPGQAGQDRWRRIVVGVDGSEGSRAALRWAAGEADAHEAELEAVTVLQPPLPLPLLGPSPALVPPPDDVMMPDVGRGEKLLEQTLEEVFGDQPPPRLTRNVSVGNPAGVLLSRALDADLLVLGPRGHGGFEGLLVGSVSEQCVRHARCSVVIARSRP